GGVRGAVGGRAGPDAAGPRRGGRRGLLAPGRSPSGRPGATAFARDPVSPRRPVDGPGAAGDPAGRGPPRRRRVGPLGDRPARPPRRRAVEGGGPAAASRPGGDRAGLAAPPGPSPDPGPADGAPLGDLGAGVGPRVAGGDAAPA